MRIVLMGQEDPVYFSPFLREVLQAKSKEVVLVVLAGKRSAGSHPKTKKEKIQNFYALWRLFEPKGFIRSVVIKLKYAFLSLFGLIGTRWDTRSLEGLAKKLKIPILHTENPNATIFLEKLKSFQPDLIINQSEILLKKPLLSLPKKGILNRHASLLPKFRGRVGSFWSHAQESPEYGVTIHFVNEDIDAGPIVLQKKYSLDPKLSYSDVLDKLFVFSLALMLSALTLLEDPSFKPLPNPSHKTTPYPFPTLMQIQAYRKRLKKRRQKC